MQVIKQKYKKLYFPKFRIKFAEYGIFYYDEKTKSTDTKDSLRKRNWVKKYNINLLIFGEIPFVIYSRTYKPKIKNLGMYSALSCLLSIIAIIPFLLFSIIVFYLADLKMSKIHEIYVSHIVHLVIITALVVKICLF